MPIISLTQKNTILAVSGILLIGLLLLTDPIPQNPAYHLLADHRHWLGTSNFANVFSNLPFAIVGLIGLFLNAENNAKTKRSWQIFFIGLIAVAVGSSYYHLNPNNQTLVWDRLPMMISFMALFVALLIENMPEYKERTALPIAVLLGLSSVIYWDITDDLRFYGFMQFAPLLAIPLMLYLFNGRYSHRNYLAYALVFYILAKVFELTDSFIFELTGQIVSGHTIKHLLAAVATYCIYVMLKQRHILKD
jgi:hypothetical protein